MHEHLFSAGKLLTQLLWWILHQRLRLHPAALIWAAQWVHSAESVQIAGGSCHDLRGPDNDPHAHETVAIGVLVRCLSVTGRVQTCDWTDSGSGIAADRGTDMPSLQRAWQSVWLF